MKAFIQVPYQYGFFKYATKNQKMIKMLLNRHCYNGDSWVKKSKEDEWISKNLNPIIIKSMLNTFIQPSAKWEKFKIIKIKKRKRKGMIK